MYPFFETLKIEHRKVEQLTYHQNRVNKTFKVFYPDFEPIQLEEIVKSFPPEDKRTKCRLEYNANFFNFECQPYEQKIHEKFKIINADSFDYSFKYSDRKYFEEQKAMFPDYELIFIQNGKITDTTYSNLIFKIKDKWYTPETYLLRGTQRERLLKEKKIETLEIEVGDLKELSEFKLINAMLDMENSYEYYTDMIEI